MQPRTPTPRKPLSARTIGGYSEHDEADPRDSTYKHNQDLALVREDDKDN
jgi:hypothetical protein